MSKYHGGLAFRNLYGYNIALMANHVWKFIDKPASLVSRFYKSKYFPHSDVLSAKASPGSSFIWNNVPVHSRLNSKGVQLPLSCPMCDSSIEDPVHLFFTCPFAVACWQYSGLSVDISGGDYAPAWLLSHLSCEDTSRVLGITKVIWGIWFFRNKKVWEDKVVTAALAMDWSSKSITECLDPGAFKFNVDAAFCPGAASFSVGLVIRYHAGDFMASKTSCQAMVSTVVEAEARAILEGLYWVSSMPYEVVAIESDSLVNVRALQGASDNLQEVGHILDACRVILDSRPSYAISFFKRQSNRVAHLVAKSPYSLNCQNVLTSPSNLLLEALLYDVS
ncbi:uncharacterized protein LOC141715263 [Apium graveolens]|uniref:uncharacterized protein LOC141715263 n=1 Tax=Apium graveolens TaxID=4045 RepID=UPI003D7B2985